VDDVTGKIQHVVLFKLAVSAEYEPEMQATIAKFCDLPGIQASFRAAGAPGLSLAQTCEALSWPDKTDGFTHCLLVVASDVPSLTGALDRLDNRLEWHARRGRGVWIDSMNGSTSSAVWASIWWTALSPALRTASIATSATPTSLRSSSSSQVSSSDSELWLVGRRSRRTALASIAVGCPLIYRPFSPLLGVVL